MSSLWRYTDRNTIEHVDGHRIKMLDGTWESPMGIDPVFDFELDVHESIAVINGGLRYAAAVRFKEKPVTA